MYSAGVRIIAVMIGSSIFAIRPVSGSLAGLSISRTSPSVVVTRYSTPGAVVTRSMVELALEPLLHDLHVQQAEEAAPEAEPQRRRGLRLVEERGVVQPQLLQRVPQLGVLVAFDRIEPGEDHRLELLEAGERIATAGRRRR